MRGSPSGTIEMGLTSFDFKSVAAATLARFNVKYARF